MRYFTIIILISLTLFNCKNINPKTEVNTKETIEIPSINKNTYISIDSIILKEYPKKFKDFYKLNNYNTVWNSKKDRQSLINYIEEIHNDGLNPEFYYLDSLKNLNNNYEKASETDKINSDLLFSKSVYNISLDLYNGHLNPKTIFPYWDLKKEELDVVSSMQLAIKNNSIKETLDDLSPKNQTYKGLKHALAELKKLPEEELKQFKTKRKIKINDSLPEIGDLKKLLVYWGDLDADETSDVFNKETQIALKKFQNRNGLEETGILNPKTIKAINTSKAKKIENIVINLERWRWYPRDLGTNYILVNIPDYNSVVVSNGDTIQHHKVIVGKSNRKTPIISSKFNELVINPTWTVPPTILKNDLTPSAVKDSNYFSKRGFVIYDRNKNVISPEDWDSKKSTSYRYVQNPGGSNPLGQIKFNFNNKHIVYLHDTNNRRNFNKTYRGLSSGCVRVENPFELANFILETEKSSYNESKILDIVKSKETKYIKLNRDINVHLLYFTAWNSKNGIQFRDDIYDWDNIILSKLNKTTKQQSLN